MKKRLSKKSTFIKLNLIQVLIFIRISVIRDSEINSE